VLDLGGIRTRDLKRPHVCALDGKASGIGRLIIIRGLNQEDWRCINVNSVEISTVKFYTMPILVFKHIAPICGRLSLSVFSYEFFCLEIILLRHAFAARNSNWNFYCKHMSLSVI
jgi:hypothetical protein